MEFKDKEAMLLHELSGTTLRLSAFPVITALNQISNVLIT